MVLVAEGFADGVDAHDAHHGGVEGVDAFFRCKGGVSGTAVVFDELADEAVARGAEIEFVARGHVHLHGHVDVLEGAFGDELLLAAEVLETTLVALGVAPVDLDVLFGGDREEDDVAVEFGHDVAQAAGHGDHVGDLDVVAAAVGGARDGVGVPVVAADDGVELGEHRDGALRVPALHAGLDARDAVAGREFDAEPLERLLHLAGGLHLLEAEFGLGEDGFGNRLDVGAVRGDGFADFLLDGGFVHDLYRGPFPAPDGGACGPLLSISDD